jgi:hypothetical protein
MRDITSNAVGETLIPATHKLLQRRRMTDYAQGFGILSSNPGQLTPDVTTRSISLIS